jgi:hypothetical protein
MFSNTLDDLPYKWYKIEKASRRYVHLERTKGKLYKGLRLCPNRSQPARSSPEIRNYIEIPSNKITQEKGKSLCRHKVDLELQ